jgi:hypothetical protein
MMASYGPGNVVPFSFDLSSLVRRSVASLYSHLVTRPTGRAIRLGIEAQLGELGASCLSVLDFTQVVVLDYSCADEAVAKLIQRYLDADRPADVYFVARGLGEQHREPIDAVLVRQHLALVAELEGDGFVLLGEASALEREAWTALQTARAASVADLARSLDVAEDAVAIALDALARRRVLLRHTSPPGFFALSGLIASV